MNRFHKSIDFCLRFLGVLACVAVVAPPSPAKEPAATAPYELKIVLDVAKTRGLTDIFCDRLERELQQGLQAALGDLAHVEVTRDHPLLEEIHKSGLGKVLDNWKEYSRFKTHFVLVDLVNDQFEIHARQYDGPTCMASPVVRSERTPDRAFVVRAISLLIEHDFGISATFPSWPVADRASVGSETVTLSIVGADAGVPLSRWVNKGDVFAVAEVYSDGRTPDRVPWSLVQIQEPPAEDAPGATCTGRLFWRFQRDADGSSHKYYRCVKLGAISGPVKVRLVKEATNKTPGPLQATLEIRRLGFTGEEATLVTGAPEQVTGLYSSEVNPTLQPFDKVAFITVRSGGRVRAFLPFPILDDHAVVVPFTANSDQSDAITQRIDRWLRHVDEAWRVHNAAVRDLNALQQRVGTDRAVIIARANEGIKRTVDDMGRLTAEKEELLHDIGQRKNERKRLDAGDKRFEEVMHDLKEGEKKLTNFVVKQNQILNEESSPERKIAKGQLLDAAAAEDQAEYDNAIELYKKALAVLDNPQAKKHLEELETQWVPRDKAHSRARKFIYETWPGLDTRSLESEMDHARSALEVCKSAHDKLSPRKLVIALIEHKNRLIKEWSELNPSLNERDLKAAEQIKKVQADMKKLLQDAVDYLKPDAD